MNYLAHLALSGEDMEVALGNFIGDGVKGAIPRSYPLPIQVGLHLHRFIDHQSDTHDFNLDMRVFLRRRYSKYAGVVQDMYHDHFLARNWSELYEADLGEFLESFYSSAEERLHLMPPRQKRFFLGMKEGAWLMNYADLDGMNRAFSGLSKRTSTSVIMQDAAHYLDKHYEFFEFGFKQWYPELKDLCHSEQELLFKKLSIQENR
jgi:acyl carrier protein phosphodiesterase